MGQFNVPVDNASAGRTDTEPSTPYRSRTRSEDIEIARKRKREDPVSWAGTRALRLLRDQRAIERAKEEEVEKLRRAERAEADRIRMTKEWERVKREDQATEDRIAAESRQRVQDRMDRAFEREQARRRAANRPLLPPPIR